MPNNDYDSDFEAAGQKYNVDPQLGKTVFHLESQGGRYTDPSIPGDPDSPTGPMMMRPSTAEMLGVDPKNIHQAIDGGMHYLAMGLNATQSPEGALKFYHGGPDQSGWKEKTNAYAAKGAALYPTMALKSGGAQPAASDTVDPDFASRWGIGTPANSNAASQTEAPVSEGDFATRWGIGKAPAAQSAPTARPAAEPAQAPVSAVDKYAGWDAPGPASVAAAPQGALSYESISHTLSPDPNATYGSILPFARDNATGALRPALPTSLRDLAQGGVDLLHGASTGTVTPKGTMALTTLVPGLTPSPAAGTGAAVSAATGSADVPRSVFDRASVARAGEIRDIATQNKLQAEAPLSPEFKANPGVTAPQTVATPAASSVNPLGATAQQRPANPLSNNASAPQPAAAVPPTPPASAQEAKELAAIPEKLPSAPLLPPTTEKSASARADELIRHFSTRQGDGASEDLIPGYQPTLAQKYNDPGLATLERGVQSINPGPFALRDEANKGLISNFVNKMKGTAEDITDMESRLEAATGGLRDAAFSNKTAADASPVEEAIQNVLAGPDSKRTAITKTLGDVQNSLHVGGKLDQPLESDPEMLYGVRKHINDLLSPAAQRDSPELQAASSQLIKVKNALDDAIEGGAPGFKRYIQHYSEMSKPIDEMKFLQSSNITDSSGNTTLQKVDSLIKTIEKQRQQPGVQKSSGVTDETLAGLNTLRNTLRANSASMSGKALGSNTFQNLATNSRVAGVAGNPLVHLGAIGLGGLGGGLPGAIAGAGIRMGANHVMHNAEEMVQRAIIERLMNIGGKGDAAFNIPTMRVPNPLSASRH